MIYGWPVTTSYFVVAKSLLFLTPCVPIAQSRPGGKARRVFLFILLQLLAGFVSRLDKLSPSAAVCHDVKKSIGLKCFLSNRKYFRLRAFQFSFAFQKHLSDDLCCELC